MNLGNDISSSCDNYNVDNCEYIFAGAVQLLTLPWILLANSDPFHISGGEDREVEGGRHCGHRQCPFQLIRETNLACIITTALITGTRLAQKQHNYQPQFVSGGEVTC